MWNKIIKGTAMQRTSVENIEQILTLNGHNQLAKLNQESLISLNVFNLKGHVNLADFTQNATRLEIVCQSPEFDILNGYFGFEKENRLKRIIEKHGGVHLDARFAHNFLSWNFSKNCYSNYFIKKISLCHENQIYSLGEYIHPDLLEMIENAKIQATTKNVEYFLSNPDFINEHAELFVLKSMHHQNNSYIKDILNAKKQIAALELRIKNAEEHISKINENIANQVSNIKDTKIPKEYIAAANSGTSDEQVLKRNLELAKKIHGHQK